jgi:alpha-L-rhamnosidase
MNSYNHYAYGAVADWIYRYAAGVDATPLDAGFHTVALHPVFDSRLGSAALDYASAYGAIHSDWIVQGKSAIWHVTIPPNTTGWLSSPSTANYKLNGIALSESKQTKSAIHDGQSGFELPSGSYSFEVNLQ